MTQDEAFDLLRLGHNVFLTGAAGSGKTHLLNRYVAHLREHGVGVAVTASTGIAATHLGGQTIHSWSGMGVRDVLADDELERLAKSDRVRRGITKTSVLIIDEVSMLHAHQLEMVEQITRYIRGVDEPFGGLQVILCGDFFQLPPVSGKGSIQEETAFAYECPAWERGAFQVCYLHEQFRQGDDALLSVLNMIRSGEVGEETKVPLRTRYRKEPEGEVRATRLYARNVNVDVINQKELAALPGEEKVFRMQSKGFGALVEGLKRSCLAPEELRLKIGAEVMFVKNAPDGAYVNGTRGVVQQFESKQGWPIVRTFDGRTIIAEPEEWRLEVDGSVRASLTQVPLRLAWAITIHKSQGMTLDAADVDLSDAFEPGMGYVALSRVRSLAGLKLMGLNDVALAVHPKILLHDRKFREWSDAAADAIARFSLTEKQTRHEEVLFERFKGACDKTKVKKGRVVKESTYEKTLALLKQRKTIAEIAKERGITGGTVIGHLEKLQGKGTLPDIEYLKPKKADFERIMEEFRKSPDGKLMPVFNALEGEYPFETLRLVRLFV